MWNNEQVERLNNLSKTLMEKVNTDLKIFDELNKTMLNNLPDDQKAQVEKLMAIRNKAINLAKEGKTDEAQSIIKQMQDECKRK